MLNEHELLPLGWKLQDADIMTRRGATKQPKIVGCRKKGSLYALESLLNRSIGLPKITQDVNIESKEILITLDLGK